MINKEIGIAVIGAGMAGKAHAAAYRSAPTVYQSTLPPLRFVSISDAFEPLAEATAKRFGFERHDTSWQAIVDADDIDVVSIVVANSLHREIAETLLNAGKHVLCEKPLSDTLDDAKAMVLAAESSNSIARIGLTFRRSPGIAYIRELVKSGKIGQIFHFNGSYWADYGCDPGAPISWRYKGPQGSGALADVGSHLSYLAEFIAGNINSVRGGSLNTVIGSRPQPIGATVGHEHNEVGSVYELVENDDFAAFSAEFESGATGTLQVSRIAAGHSNSLSFEVFGEKGTARFDFRHPGEVQLFLSDDEASNSGFRTITLGPKHPYWRGGLPMDAAGVGIGQNEGFVFQARAFLEEVAGIKDSESLPRNAGFEEGIRNMILLEAVAESARLSGASVNVKGLSKEPKTFPNE